MRPANVFVADFLGDFNLIPVKVRDANGSSITVELDKAVALWRSRATIGMPTAGAQAALLIRPEEIALTHMRRAAPDLQMLSGTVASQLSGRQLSAERLPRRGGTLRATIPRATGPQFRAGPAVTLSWAPRRPGCCLTRATHPVGEAMTAHGRPCSDCDRAGRQGGDPSCSRVPESLAGLLLLPCFAWIIDLLLCPARADDLAQRHRGKRLDRRSTGRSLSSPHYLKVFGTSLQMASITTVFALLLGYPVAYALTIAGPNCVDLDPHLMVPIPYWVDIIVRSFSWLVMLGDNGIVNKALMQLGLTHTSAAAALQPVQRAARHGADPAADLIITLFGAMLRIDRNAPAGRQDPWRKRLAGVPHVFLPLSLPGVYGACLLVFVIGLGFFVTPALLGSPAETMISQTIMIEATKILD